MAPSQSAKVRLTIEEPTVAIDGVAADRNMVEELGQLGLFVVCRLLALVAAGDVLEAPQRIAGAVRDRLLGDAQPRVAAVGMGDRESAACARIGGEPGDRAPRQIARAEEPPERGIGIIRPPVGPDDQARLG